MLYEVLAGLLNPLTSLITSIEVKLAKTQLLCSGLASLTAISLTGLLLGLWAHYFQTTTAEAAVTLWAGCSILLIFSLVSIKRLLGSLERSTESTDALKQGLEFSILQQQISEMNEKNQKVNQTLVQAIQALKDELDASASKPHRKFYHDDYRPYAGA